VGPAKKVNSGEQLFPFRWLALPAAGTDYCNCQVRRENSGGMNEEDQKENLPIEALLFRQIFCSGRRLAFFLRECFALPPILRHTLRDKLRVIVREIS
jgi:hypothetical protein